MLAVSRTTFARVGGYTCDLGRGVRELAAVSATVIFAALQPRHWPRTVRSVFARQLLFTGVEAMRFVIFVAVLTGITVVVESYVWLDKVGLSQRIGSVLVVLVARELGPLLVNIIIVVRSGSAMAAELAVMKVSGEVLALEAQGVDPLLYLLMPRALAMVIATLCLTVLFSVVAFASGYSFGAFIHVMPDRPGTFLDSVFRSISVVDVWSITAKCTVPALLTSVICATQGLSAAGSLTSVPLATKRALSLSVGALFATIAVISLLVYG